jgi:hypothetical protein
VEGLSLCVEGSWALAWFGELKGEITVSLLPLLSVISFLARTYCILYLVCCIVLYRIVHLVVLGSLYLSASILKNNQIDKNL